MRIKVRVKHSPATPPEFFEFESAGLGLWRLTGNTDRAWTAADILASYNVLDPSDLWLLAKEVRSAALDGAYEGLTDAEIVAFLRALPAAPAVPAAPEPDPEPTPEPAPEEVIP